MNKPYTAVDKLVFLRKAITNRKEEAADFRSLHSSLISQLVEDPENATLARQIAEAEASLATVLASINTLETAAEEASELAQAEAAKHAIEATEAQRQRAINAAQERLKAAAAVDEAAQRFVAALRALRQAGLPVAADAKEVLVARKQGQAYFNASGLVLPHATGTSRDFAAALGDVLRQVVDEFGEAVLSDFIAVNRFATTDGRTFAKASEVAAEQLEAML